MGLFDTGGGLDMSSLLNYLNPVGAANAQPSNMAIQPGNSTPGNVPNFDERFSGGGPSPAPPVVAPAAGQSRGIVPPSVVPLPAASVTDGRDVPPVPPSPIVPNPSSIRSPVVPPPAIPLGSDDAGITPGAALTGNNVTGEATTPANAAPTAGGTKNPSLAQALKGVVAPPAPVLQKISSPSPPRPTGQIKGGELMALLQALNAGAPNMQRGLPTTLGGK